MTSQPTWFAQKFWWLYALVIGILLFGVIQLTYAQAVNTATITFQSSTQFADGTPYPPTALINYELYQGIKGAAKTKVGTFVSGGSITTGLLSGNEYCWDIVTVYRSAVGAQPMESAHSNEACKKFGVPGTVTITVT